MASRGDNAKLTVLNSTIFLNGPFGGQNGASKPLKRGFLRDKYLTISHLARSDPTIKLTVPVNILWRGMVVHF